MKGFWTDIIIVAASLLAGWFIGDSIIKGFELRTMKREAINLGYAQHNPTNGTFEWKTIK